MSIFISNLKSIIGEELKNLGKSAAVNDGSVFNKLANAIGLGRNPAITEAKAQIITTLLGNIKAVSEDLSDKEAAQEITKLCMDAIVKEKEITQGVAGSGHFGELMPKISLLPEVLLAEIENYKTLLNCPYSQDPLGFFKYHAACYLMKRTASSHLYPNAIIPAEWDVSSLKKTKLKHHLDECIRRISVLDTKNAEYTKEILRHVKEAVKNIQTENREIIKENSVNLFFTTVRAHAPGFLDVCMKNVIDDIAKMNNAASSETPSQMELRTASSRKKIAAAGSGINQAAAAPALAAALDPAAAPAPAPTLAFDPNSDTEAGFDTEADSDTEAGFDTEADSDTDTDTKAEQANQKAPSPSPSPSPLTIHRRTSPPPSPNGNEAPKRHSGASPTFFPQAPPAEPTVQQQVMGPSHSEAPAEEPTKPLVQQQEVDTIGSSSSAAAAEVSPTPPKTTFSVVYFQPAPAPKAKAHTKAGRRKQAQGNVTAGKRL